MVSSRLSIGETTAWPNDKTKFDMQFLMVNLLMTTSTLDEYFLTYLPILPILPIYTSYLFTYLTYLPIVPILS